jgi:uncharacterized SAM-binding protein YcdF (DUF218 family)
MSDDDLTPDQIAAITAYVDIEAPPPDEPTAHVIFGTNQAQPAAIVAGRYRQALAPLIIATGGINRHNGVVEGQMFRRLLTASGVPDGSIRVEDQSADTWQNVELSLPFLRQALASGLRLTAVSKWYHRRAVHALRTLVPEADILYAISWEPVYAGALVTRGNWPKSPDGRRRVIREWQEVPRRVRVGSYHEAVKAGGAWR